MGITFTGWWTMAYVLIVTDGEPELYGPFKTAPDAEAFAEAENLDASVTVFTL